jgi:hypothetical protein
MRTAFSRLKMAALLPIPRGQDANRDRGEDQASAKQSRAVSQIGEQRLDPHNHARLVHALSRA